MSLEDSTVRLPTEEPHQSLTAHTQHQTSATSSTTLHPNQYSHTPLPPVHPKSIRIMFNNTNAIQTEKPAMLANTMKQYITHKPSILGLIERR
jgi:hypothetical protein